MLKIWGRTTSSNVQKVMWAVAELGLGGVPPRVADDDLPARAPAVPAGDERQSGVETLSP